MANLTVQGIFFFVRLRLRWSRELGLPLQRGLVIVRVLVSLVES